MIGGDPSVGGGQAGAQDADARPRSGDARRG
jgi:hypothetical protein